PERCSTRDGCALGAGEAIGGGVSTDCSAPPMAAAEMPRRSSGFDLSPWVLRLAMNRLPNALRVEKSCKRHSAQTAKSRQPTPLGSPRATLKLQCGADANQRKSRRPSHASRLRDRAGLPLRGRTRGGEGEHASVCADGG